MNETLIYAQNLLLAQRRGRTLTVAENEAISQAFETFGPEAVYMDGELFTVDV
jgi:hypothetical protein